VSSCYTFTWSRIITYHHHTTTDGVERVGGNSGSGGDTPSEGERGQEVTLKLAGKDDRLDGVVHTEVKTTVDDDSKDGRSKSTVKTGNTVRGDGLLVDVDESLVLTLSSGLGGFVVVGKTGTGVVEGVDEEEGGGTSGSSGGQVTGHPLGVSVTLLLVSEHRLELVTESEVQSLGREVTDDVGGVSTPEGDETLIGHGALEAVSDTGVLAVKTSLLDHLIL
jgi:hypothetical protein